MIINKIQRKTSVLHCGLVYSRLKINQAGEKNDDASYSDDTGAVKNSWTESWSIPVLEIDRSWFSASEDGTVAPGRQETEEDTTGAEGVKFRNKGAVDEVINALTTRKYFLAGILQYTFDGVFRSTWRAYVEVSKNKASYTRSVSTFAGIIISAIADIFDEGLERAERKVLKLFVRKHQF